MPGHVRGCTVSEPMYPRRSPPRSQHPTFGIFHRGDLRFERSTHHAHRQTGKLQAQTLETPVTRCATASCSANPPTTSGGEGAASPTRPGAMSVGAKEFARHGASSGSSAKKFAQQTHTSGVFAKKLAQQAQMQRNLGFLARWANFFALSR